MDLIDKVFHIQILDAHVQNYIELGEDVEIEFVVLDGPLTGCHLKSTLDKITKTLYLKQTGSNKWRS